MKWKKSPRIKIYEALGAIGDKRVELHGATAKVFSSAGTKFYDVNFDAKTNVISANDNGSFWQGYLGYPAISFLLLNGTIMYDKKSADWLCGVAWKEINTKFHNDFDKTEKLVREMVVAKHGAVLEELDAAVARIEKDLDELQLNKPEKRARPPKE